MVSPIAVATAASMYAFSSCSNDIYNATTHQAGPSKYIFTVPKGTQAQQAHWIKICESLYPQLRTLQDARLEARILLPDCVTSINAEEFGYMSHFEANDPSWEDFTTDATIDYTQMKLIITIDFPSRHEGPYTQALQIGNGLISTCKGTTPWP